MVGGGVNGVWEHAVRGNGGNVRISIASGNQAWTVKVSPGRGDLSRTITSTNEAQTTLCAPQGGADVAQDGDELLPVIGRLWSEKRAAHVRNAVRRL